jgi:hypothetical protein
MLRPLRNSMKDGTHIAALLNLAATEPALRSECQAIEEMALELIALTEDVSRAPAFWGMRHSPDEEINRGRAKRRERLEKFNAIHLRPHTWHVELTGWNKGVPVFVDLPTSITSTPSLMFTLVQLARVQLIDRLRKCAHCEIWFFALKPWARFHNELCRKAAARSEPGFQEKNRDYQRNYFRESLSVNQDKYRDGFSPSEVRALNKKRKDRTKKKHKGKGLR